MGFYLTFYRSFYEKFHVILHKKTHYNSGFFSSKIIIKFQQQREFQIRAPVYLLTYTTVRLACGADFNIRQSKLTRENVSASTSTLFWVYFNEKSFTRPCYGFAFEVNIILWDRF